MFETISHSPNETSEIGFRLGKALPPNSVVCFFGDLAAGKTTFIKGLVEGSAGYPKREINSPTFTYLNIYEGNRVVYHMDLYRICSEDEFFSMGLDEFLDANGICCIEWAERIEKNIPPHSITIKMKHENDGKRRITISPNPWEKEL